MKLADIIKYEGNNHTFVWKHPCEDFNTMTQVIVHESQQALLYCNGQALDLFGPGRHTLSTQNIPLLRRLTNLATDGTSPFHCEIYFINMTEQMGIDWGTDSQVSYIDPVLHIPLSIGAHGQLSLQVTNPRHLLVQLVGTETGMDQSQLADAFRAFIQMRVKAYLAKAMREQVWSIFAVDEHIIELSEAIKKSLVSDFTSYGLSLKQFLVTGTIKPEGDEKYEELRSLYFRQYADIRDAEIRQKVGIVDQETEKQRMIIGAQGLAEKRCIEGYTYQEQRGFDVAEQLAQNEGMGNFTNAGIGLGMMAGMGTFFGSNMQNALGQTAAATGTERSFISQAPAAGTCFCAQCGTQLAATWKFCPNCGHGNENPVKK